jgi:hypothetical protein
MQYLYRKIFTEIIVFILFFLSGTGYAQSICINEFMALNQTVLTDEDGEYSDWIEIFNPTGTEVDLEGWGLTDEPDLPYKWLFPDITINAGEYLVVFASGKDRSMAGSELHANFKLSSSGEYLALFNPYGIAITEFNPAYPAQHSDFSYGLYENSYIEFSDPTPGEANNLTEGIVLPAPEFNVKHGFFKTPFDLVISSGLADVAIYYTTDGSTPDESSGILYTAPLNIHNTSIIRAVTTKGGEAPSRLTTQTYIFPDSVIHQSNSPVGYPTIWGPYTAIPGISIADYEMDPEMMVDTEFATSVKEALLDLPAISLVTDKGFLFSHSEDPDTGGIYIYTGPPLSETTYGTGREWERPVSFEFFDNDSLSLQVDCGLKIQGGHGRRPEKSPKHSFMLEFKSEYGPSKLNYSFFGEEGTSEYNKLILRAGFGNSWIHHSSDERQRAQYQRDIWTKDTQRAMGHPASNSIYAHLYINGIYWGIYAPSERMDCDFASKYIGGEPGDYDVIKDYAEVANGDITAWDQMMQMANAGLESNEDYQRIQGNNADGTPDPNNESMVDVISLADYMLINFFGSNTDWDQHNWTAMRNRVDPGTGFKFLCWDAEHMLESVNGNILSINNNNCPSRVFHQLTQNEEFRRLFADRVQRYCFNNDLLTPEATAARWMTRRSQIEEAVLAESARWGDYRRDVHPYQTAGPFDLYTKEDYWLPQQDFMLNTYFPQRTDVFLNQLRNANLFSRVDAPVFYLNDEPIENNIVSTGDMLSMTVSEGAIYYTTNGTDPVNWGTADEGDKTNFRVNDSITTNDKFADGSVSEDAVLYSGPISIGQSIHVKARTFQNNEWSATSDNFFIIPSNYHDLKITEIHYHPLGDGVTDGNQYEFIEIKNTGTSTMDIGGLRFIKGIEFEFPPETEIGPGKFIVLASNNHYFSSRYHFRPFGEYNGKLDNNGELLVLVSNSGDTISSIRYYDSGGWPNLPDGSGNSLVPVDINPANDQNSPSDWRASYSIGGSPGADDVPQTFIPITENAITMNVVRVQNYPNPFKDITYFEYRLPLDAFVELSVYNVVGQQITNLVNNHQFVGLYRIEWNGKDKAGTDVPDGIYIYRISILTQNQSKVLTGKMILIR